MRVLVTGSEGFIGRNLIVRLKELTDHEVRIFNRGDSLSDLAEKVSRSDAVIHLAGVNRPKDLCDFAEGNANLTLNLCEIIASSGRNIPLIISSSAQANLDNPYGRSKRDAELAGEDLARKTGNSVIIYRLPGVFGKWCKPNYNSVVATFCHNIANDLSLIHI